MQSFNIGGKEIQMRIVFDGLGSTELSFPGHNPSTEIPPDQKEFFGKLSVVLNKELEKRLPGSAITYVLGGLWVEIPRRVRKDHKYSPEIAQQIHDVVVEICADFQAIITSPQLLERAYITARKQSDPRPVRTGRE